MSDEQRAEARAAGAIDTFIEQMGLELFLKNRSPEYNNAFWKAFKLNLEEKVRTWDYC